MMLTKDKAFCVDNENDFGNNAKARLGGNRTMEFRIHHANHGNRTMEYRIHHANHNNN